MSQLALLGSDFSPNSESQASRQLVNFYLEPGEGVEGKQWTALPTPGYRDYISTPGSTIRGMLNHTETGFFVSGNTLYEITNLSLGIHVARGTLNTSTGRVSMAGIEDEIVIVDGTNGYSYVISTDTFTVITDTDFIDDTPVVLGTQDYFITIDTNSNSYFHSAIGSGTDWPALNTAAAEINYDKLVSAVVSNTRVWFFCETTTEVWYNKGNPTGSAFSRTSGGAFQYGCAAKHSVVASDNTVYWLAKNEGGLVGIMQATESASKVISSTAMLEDIQSYTRSDDAFGFAYQQGKHSFYQITFPNTTPSGAGVTWLYDISTDIWSKLESDDRLSGTTPYYRIAGYYARRATVKWEKMKQRGD